MGLSSIHQIYGDFVRAENITKNATFYCNVKTNNFSKMQVVQNINMAQIQCVIIINGFADVSIGDLIRLPMYAFDLLVENIDTQYDERQFRKRKDLSNFTGTTMVALS